MEENITYSREGYLTEKFRLFHLKDNVGQELDFHYHEFDKIVIFLSGKVNYVVEGVSYNLEPWDIVLVSHHLIHKAVIDTSEPYERMIVYLDSGFAKRNDSPEESLMSCFRIAEKRGFYLMRAGEADRQPLMQILHQLEQENNSQEFGAELMRQTLVVQMLIRLNRIMFMDQTNEDGSAYDYDPQIASVLSYINEHLDTELTVEMLAAKCYISKYHFMRKFKDITGFTVHHYICQKRLIMAVSLLRGGTPATKVASLCGFQDYSTFIRAFKKSFGVSPGKFS